VALGACVVEKHFTLDRDLSGPDHKASLEPDELKRMIEGIRTVESAMGNGVKLPAGSELNTAQVARRSLVAACRIVAGTVITGDMVAILRPGTGLHPGLKPRVVGKRVIRDVQAGDLFSFENLS
jgi:N,N'-diacetyllegionaminate synthase